jgi:phage protein D
VDGAPVPPEALQGLIALSCRQDLSMADTVEVRLSNKDLRWTEGDTFAEGKKLSVKLGYVETDIQVVATGEIVRRECEFPERGPAVITIVALDKEFRLKHGKKNRTFKDQKDSDVVKKLAGEAGLSADVEDTQVTHKYLFQANQTNLEFIKERARRLGYVVQIDREGAKLSFKKPKTGDAKVQMLKWGVDLLSYRPRYSLDEMFAEVKVRAWDMTQKKEIKAQATPSGDVINKMGLSRLGSDLAKKSSGKIEVLYPETPVFTQDEATQMAKSYANSLLHNYAEGEASSQGSNKIVPGSVVEIEGCGKRANGNVYVVATLHHYEPKGYTTYFTFVRPTDTVGPSNPVVPKPPKPAPPDGPVVEPENQVTFNVMVGEGVEYSSLSYTATAPDGTSKSGNVEPGGKVVMKGLKKPGDATFELKAPPDVSVSQPKNDAPKK